MSFYHSIANYYEDIFPLNKIQVEFVKRSFLNTEELSLLDIGCGTGSLSIELGKIFRTVVAIDLDVAMIEKALDKNQSIVGFIHLSMLDIESKFGQNAFDTIICFGNTLVHLNGPDQILDFFIQSKKVLKENGKLFFQLINYDRIIDHNIGGLPTIENEEIRFERNYRLHPNQKLLEFETILFVKKTGQTIENSIQLYPVRSREIAHLLEKAGFTGNHFFSNFKREAFSEGSIPLVVEVR